MKALLTDSVHKCLVDGLNEMGFVCDLKEGIPKNKVLEIIKDYEGAINDITKALETNLSEYMLKDEKIIDDQDLYFSRGIFKDKQKDYQGAINDFTKAI